MTSFNLKRFKQVISIFFIVIVASIMALLTSFFYGKFYSHPRYWEGTIERVNFIQAELLSGLIFELNASDLFPRDFERISKIFMPLSGKLAIDLYDQGDIVWSNSEKRFIKGERLKEIALSNNRLLVLTRYAPPKWSKQYWRWLKNPVHWFRPSFDFITAPFLAFLIIYMCSFFCIVFFVKSSYLERDAIKLLRSLEEKLNL